MFSDLYHVLPSVPVSFTKNTLYMKFRYFGVSVSMSGLYVPYVVQYTWDGLTHHDNWHFRHSRTGSPGTHQARYAGKLYSGAEDAGRDAVLQKMQGKIGDVCRTTMHHSCLQPVKNPAPPLGGSATLTGHLRGLSDGRPESLGLNGGGAPRTPQGNARFCPKASPRCG